MAADAGYAVAAVLLLVGCGAATPGDVSSTAPAPPSSAASAGGPAPPIPSTPSRADGRLRGPIRLMIVGDGDRELEGAAALVLRNIFWERGCKLEDAPSARDRSDPSTPGLGRDWSRGRVGANVVLSLMVSDDGACPPCRQTVRAEVELLDGRTGSGIIEVVRLPPATAEGATVDSASHALGRDLAAKLRENLAPRLAGLECR